MDTQKQYPKTFSCEFFPPKTPDGKANLCTAIQELLAIQPAYFSCTYGAGGTTQEGTYEAIQDILAAGVPGTPHITCIGSTRDKIRGLLNDYRNLGVDRLVALRGDLPEGMTDPGEFRFANELVAFIREETGDHFHIEVAAYPEKHPQAKTFAEDLHHFKLKVDAGASAGITQYFFVTEAYRRFIDDIEKLGVDIPVVPGIMPITNYRQLSRFSSMCGAEIPRWIRGRLEDYGDDMESIRAFGLEVVTRLCEDLLALGAPGLHFYTLNRSAPTLALWENLGL